MKTYAKSLVALLALFPMIASAHPGGVNSAGCHVCRTNCASWGLEYGEYHCSGKAANNTNEGTLIKKQSPSIFSSILRGVAGGVEGATHNFYTNMRCMKDGHFEFCPYTDNAIADIRQAEADKKMVDAEKTKRSGILSELAKLEKARSVKHCTFSRVEDYPKFSSRLDQKIWQEDCDKLSRLVNDKKGVLKPSYYGIVGQ